MRFIVAILVYFAVILACVGFLVTGCATVPTPTTPTCEALIGSVAAPATQAGYKMAGTQAGPAGEMAIFVRGTAARLIYVSPAAGVTDYLVTSGWTSAGECTAKTATYTVLQRDIEIPPVGSPT